MEPPTSQREPVEALAEEFVERYRRGERPPLSEYIDRCPEQAERIRRLFPTLLLMEKLAPDSETLVKSEAEGSTETSLPPSVPERIGDFRIVREVGRGGMGVVYEAVQESLGRHVALKVVGGHGSLEARHLQRFRREAQAAAMLHHTNIVPVFDVGQHEGVHYYAMQFIQGLGLNDVLDALRRLRGQRSVTEQAAATVAPAVAAELAQSMISGQFYRPDAASAGETPRPGEATGLSSSDVHLPGQADHLSLSETGASYFASVARIGIQVASALEYAHGHRTLHRDIKPSNLLLDAQGTVWVADFGLAKSLELNDLTRTGEIVGTLRYMPPEQLEGRCDARSDVYSLGLTLYELLTLEPAYDEVDRARLLHSLVQGEPIRPRKRDATIPRDLETVVLKAIEREPRRRYQTAAELGADLERFLEGKPIRARQVGAWERTVKAIRRRPAVSTLAGLLLVAVVAGFALVTWKWREAEHQKTLAAQQAARNEALAKTELRLRRMAEEAQKAEARQAELARLEAAKADEVANFLIGLFQGSDPVGLSGYRFGAPPSEETVPTAHDLLRRGTERVRSELAEAPEIQAAVMDHLGRTWLSLGSIAEAEPLLQAALDWRREHHGVEHPDTARSLAAMGVLRYVQGNYDAAVPLLREAMTSADKTLGAAHRDGARIKFLFASVLLESGGGRAAANEALRVLQELVELLRPAGRKRPRDLALALTGLAMARQVTKDFQGALASLAEAAAVLSSLPESDRVLSALALSVQAVTHWKLGNEETAQRLTDECVQQFQEILGRDHPALNYFRVYTARLFYRAGDLDRAEALLRQGVANAQRAYGRQPRTAKTMQVLAELLADRGQWDEAKTLCEDALAINMAVLGPDSSRTQALERLLSRIEENRTRGATPPR
jgi:serine/threonine protein kinase/tetratricopeptide (TPR) repeat protein